MATSKGINSYQVLSSRHPHLFLSLLLSLFFLLSSSLLLSVAIFFSFYHFIPRLSRLPGLSPSFSLFLYFLPISSFILLRGNTDRSLAPSLYKMDRFGWALSGYQDLDNNGIREIVIGCFLFLQFIKEFILFSLSPLPRNHFFIHT